MVRFEDLPRLFAAGRDGGHIDDVTFRLDTRISHVLLDEFQDTSLAQWDVMRPFAEECQASNGEKTFFCVGDVKQAIYGWRGGVSEIFDAVHATMPGLESRSLTKSFRSCPIVIETVNQVFTGLANNQALADFGEVTRRWGQHFEPHTTTKTELAGHTRLIVAQAC